MPTVVWSGPTPPAKFAAALKAKGVDMARASDAASIRIVHTRTAAKVPRAIGSSRWIWYCDRPVSDAHRIAAIERGAYDVVDARDGDAAAQLMARVDELLVPEPTPPAADNLVSASEVSRRVIAQVARVASTSMPVLITG